MKLLRLQVVTSSKEVTHKKRNIESISSDFVLPNEMKCFHTTTIKNGLLSSFLKTDLHFAVAINAVLVTLLCICKMLGWLENWKMEKQT